MTQKNRQDQLFMGEVARNDRELYVPARHGVAGATATVGYVATGVNTALVTLAQSATADIWIVPLDGLHVGDKLTAVSLIAQVESAGGAVTLAISVRKMTAAAADWVDAELDSAASGSLTADTLISADGTEVKVSGLAEILAEGEHLYVKITCTTAATTDIAIGGLLLTYDKK